ncbi:MAG: hypothetical protein OXB88_11600 [Bacteriovoracales bacterium]|nr:hypothetical protein [Bacteriovoracales bacterium]
MKFEFFELLEELEDIERNMAPEDQEKLLARTQKVIDRLEADKRARIERIGLRLL